MDHTREELDQLAAGYISDTMSCIHRVQEFCDRHSKWLQQRKSELKRMRDIADRAEMINLTTDHYKKSKNKPKAVWEIMWSKVTQVTAERRSLKLKKELGCLLPYTVEGLEKLTPFLEAVEMLAVTSLSVFEEENPVCQLPEGVSADAVRSIITAARQACPLLLHFKRDDGKFFQTSLVNVDLLAFQLDKYLTVFQELCEKLQESPLGINYSVTGGLESILEYFWRRPRIHLRQVTSPSQTIENMFDHLTELTKIRSDQNFRMTYLFRGSAQWFIDQFSLRRSRMQQFLVALEEGAVQLDRVQMVASISSVVGRCVGLVGGILSIVGLALAPVTAGASLIFTIIGAWLGITSAVTSFITCYWEFIFNTHHGTKINDIFHRYFEDVKTMLQCLQVTPRCTIPNTVPGVLDAAAVVVTFAKTSRSVYKWMDLIVDCISIIVVRSEEVASSTVKVASQEVNAAQNVTNVAADLTDIGQLAKGIPSALTKTVSVWFIVCNLISMCGDLFFICKDSISLYNRDTSDVSKVIRRKASLWKTELDAWEKIDRSLCTGRLSSERSEEVLQRPFYT